MAKAKVLSDAALNVLGTLQIVDTQATVTGGQLDRKVYVEVSGALETLGGKWNKKLGAHVFPADPTEGIEEIIQAGGFEKNPLDFFRTPATLAARVVELADIQAGMLVLEPSAGEGDIVRVIPEGVTVHAVELDRGRSEVLERVIAARGEASVAIRADFLAVQPNPYDRVVMNPPFGRQADIDHVMHAAKFLKPGGKLVAVMAGSVEFRDNKKTVAFREYVASLGGTIERLPDGTFSQSGTGVRTVLVAFSVPE